MKTLLTLVFALFIASTLTAQSYKVGEDNQLVQVKDSTTTKQVKPDDINRTGLTKTSYTITKKGVEYPVYQGKNGGYYIIRRSAKSGKEYKQYIKIQR